MIQYIKTSAAALAVCATFALSAQAQIETPQPSRAASVTQKIGLTEVTVNYSRPSMKGRRVFGNLVPYGKPWRTGANNATTITFKDVVTIGGTRVEPGEYAMYTIPTADNWTVVFNKDTKLGGDVASYKPDMDVARVQVRPEQTGMEMETFTILFTDLTPKSANLALMWERTLVKVPIVSDPDARVMASISEAMKGTDVKPNTYFTAARYYYDNNKDMKQALEWVNKATAKDARFWMLHTKALIQAANNDYSGAIATAKQSIELARTAGNEEYVKMNQEKINEWTPKAGKPAQDSDKKKKKK